MASSEDPDGLAFGAVGVGQEKIFALASGCIFRPSPLRSVTALPLASQVIEVEAVGVGDDVAFGFELEASSLKNIW